jgi:hypothetical protein
MRREFVSRIAALGYSARVASTRSATTLAGFPRDGTRKPIEPSAADMKFPHHLRKARLGNFKSNAALEL